jgi:pimeloyl-ACP methyl ester carboxylesterase
MTAMSPLHDAPLPAGIRSRFVDGINGLRVHVLDAGYEDAGRPCILLLHGFPELAYSWRKVMTPLAAAGFHVVAPDQRGYGRTTGWSADYGGDLAPFRFSILFAMRSVLFGSSARTPLRRLSVTISARRPRHGAHWCDPMCSARSR